MGNAVHKFQFADHNRTLEEIKIAHGRYWAFPYQRGKHNFDAVWIMVNAVETVIGTQFYRYEPIGEKSN